MALSRVRAALSRLRTDCRQQMRLACVLWILLAIVVWNVVFDRMLVLAGRRYSYAAAAAFQSGQSPVLIAPWMRAAQAEAVRVATLVAVPIALVGVVAVALASRRRQRI